MASTPEFGSWRSVLRAWLATSATATTWYCEATIWLADVKSRRPPVKLNEMTPNSMPKPAPMRIAASQRSSPPLPKRLSSRPTNRPKYAPLAAPAPATRG